MQITAPVPCRTSLFMISPQGAVGRDIKPRWIGCHRQCPSGEVAVVEDQEREYSQGEGRRLMFERDTR